MQRQQVVSGPIHSIGYDPSSGILEIEMTSFAVYQYKNVPPDVFASFMADKSKGGFYAARIRGSYPSKREHIAECGNESIFPAIEGESWTSTAKCDNASCKCFCHKDTNRENSRAKEKKASKKGSSKKKTS